MAIYWRLNEHYDIIFRMEINKDGKVFIGLIVVLIVAIVGVVYKITKPSSGSQVNVTSNNNQPIAMNVTTQPVSSNDGLQITDEVVGTGAEAVAGKKVTVHYVGTLTDGKKFDSSRDRGTPFTFDLGAGQVIKGWDEGVAGMKVGGKRKLVIPPALAYGNREMGNGLIPANSTLIFEVELLNVQ